MAPGTVSTSVAECVMCKIILLHIRKVVKIIQIESQGNVPFVGRPKWYTDSQLDYHKLTKHGIDASASKKQ